VRLHAALKRRFFTLCWRAWRSPQIRVKGKININININVNGDGQERPSHMIQWRKLPVRPARACRVGILRLRMTSTSWASCFAQDDRAYWAVRGNLLWFVAFGVGFFWIIGVYAGLNGYGWGIWEWGI